MPVVEIRDESRPGRVVSGTTLDLPDRISLRELIRTRVREEVAIANLERSKPRHLLVQPIDAEVTLNGYVRTGLRPIDWEVQAQVAFDAFQANAFFVLVDDHQVEELDSQLVLTPDSVVRFLRLTPLVGG